MPPIAPPQLDVLFTAFRDSRYLNHSLDRTVRLLGVSEAVARARIRDTPELEVERIHTTKAPEGFFDVVRPVFTPENIVRLAPIAVHRLAASFGKSAEGARALEAVLNGGGEAAAFHIRDGEVLPGPGASDPVRVVPPNTMDHAPAAYVAGPLDEAEDLRVLGHLENLEAERINFGVYETFVPVAELLRRIQEMEPGLRSAAPAELEAAVERLGRHQYLIRLAEDRVRSRISETVRVLKRVKQRFNDGDSGTAPYLVHSVRVHFADRKRLDRTQHTLADALDGVFEWSRGKGMRVDRARHALLEGFARAINSPDPADVRITRIQRDAIDLIGKQYLDRGGRGYVITGNTGSGKTEAALFPLLLGAMEEKLRAPEAADGCKVILVYPRQELAKNQLQRICRYLAYINQELANRGGGDAALTTGILFGDTPFDQTDLESASKRGWEEADGRRVVPYFLGEGDRPVTMSAFHGGVGAIRSSPGGFADGGWEFEGFRATRDAMRRSPPDILIVTTETLHRWLMDPEANELFGVRRAGGGAARFTVPRAVVFDEIHLYDTTHGAQIGMLLRRLRNRLNRGMASAAAGWAHPLVIGMSATIGDPADFWERLTGLPGGLITALNPEPGDMEAAQGREYFLFIRPEGYSRGKLVGDATVAIQTVMALAHNLRRRGPQWNGAQLREPAKHRALVFQDSISKIKKLALEFMDAESNNFLARLRLATPAGPDPLASPQFDDGEYWVFDAGDPFQYSERRVADGDAPVALTSPDLPVYGANKGSHLLKKDIVFATSVLEVGYDDPSIQLVLQHHAPRNVASFVQKKGRAGRSLQDRPVTAVTLSRLSYRDAFYYQNPRLLYDPSDYRPPLNVENYFVQRFQSVAMLFDELARLTGQNLTKLQPDPTQDDVEARLRAVDQHIVDHAGALEAAYAHVTADSFRRMHPTLRTVWEWFRDGIMEPAVMHEVRGKQDLVRGHPELPDTLFGTINLPTLRVVYPRENRNQNRNQNQNQRRFGGEEEDVALAFGEVAPGKVTRRYGHGHVLHWRRPKPWVDIERYKRGAGPFNPALVQSLPAIWGPDWADYLPRQLHGMYANALPSRFYRARFVEVWDFGSLDPNDPREPQDDWVDWGELLPNGEVTVKFWRNGPPPVHYSDHFRRTRNPDVDPWRRVLPDSNSFPLSSAYVRPHQEGEEISPDAGGINLPPFFPGLLDELRLYCGEVDGRRSALDVWEIHYGAEASVKLRSERPRDPHAGTGHALVRYFGGDENQRLPTLYGYDLNTEGLRAPYDPNCLEENAQAVFDELWNEPNQRNHLQDKYLRYLLKTETWPAGAPDPMNLFDVRVAAELISTLRAEARAQQVAPGAFLDALTSDPGLAGMVADARARYWRDTRVLNDGFVARFTSTLTTPATRPFLDRLFQQIQSSTRVREFLQVTILHSLKHAVRHLFITEGSTRDEEVGSFGMFRLTHPQWSPNSDFYVYERNQDGNGATRLVGAIREPQRLPHLVERWWDVTMSCPVGDEEDFLRAALTAHGAALRGLSAGFFAAPLPERQSPKEDLIAMFPALARDLGLLGRLAGILTSQVEFGGGGAIPLVELHLEIEALRAVLAARFGRPPTQAELAGHAATEVDNDPAAARFPALGALRALYRAHRQEVGGHDDEAPSNDLERFMDQVQHLSLGTCVDACAACLASTCGMGHIEVMRHTLSRRYLKRVHEWLTRPFTVALHAGVTEDDIVRAAGAGGGWVILTYQDRIPEQLNLPLRDQFELLGRMFDYERMELRSVRRIAGNE